MPAASALLAEKAIAERSRGAHPCVAQLSPRRAAGMALHPPSSRVLSDELGLRLSFLLPLVQAFATGSPLSALSARMCGDSRFTSPHYKYRIRSRPYFKYTVHNRTTSRSGSRFRVNHSSASRSLGDQATPSCADCCEIALIALCQSHSPRELHRSTSRAWYRYPPKMGPISPELIHVFGRVNQYVLTMMTASLHHLHRRRCPQS